MDPKLLAKAEALRVLSPKESKAWRDAAAGQAKQNISQMLNLTLGKPDATSLQFNNTTAMNKAVDLRTTVDVARALRAPTGGMAGMHAETASLLTMGEGVALTAYDDPPGAGTSAWATA